MGTKKAEIERIRIEKAEILHDSYLSKTPHVVNLYCREILSKLDDPSNFPKQFELEYNPENELLIVEYSLPNIDAMPSLKEVKYIQSKNNLVEVQHSQSTINSLYDKCIYQIALRSLYVLYQTDTKNVLTSIVFNGWVHSIDPTTGKKITACILSLQANREEILSLDLANVDPKLCVKALKGIGSSKLHGLVPIAPILNISREDKRFVQSYDVAHTLDDSVNLAAMDWEDFEHLIRELFEKEFKEYGGEVKITQASRDRGVDAIAFNPDPIHGGKTVIQAKRYTNVVGVAAVRDLYGTVINEGATKGILVTTADYGPDSYSFAKDKPLVLLSGSNLLKLLEKHGHKARINIREAKELFKEKESE